MNQGFNGVGAGMNRYVNCMGMGMCGTCRVLITAGKENTNAMTAVERFKFKAPVPDPVPCLAYIGHEETMRLACKTRVFGDIEVVSGPEIDLFGENFFS